MADTSRELKRDLQLKTEELQTLMYRFKEVREEGENARKERDALHVQLSELQSQLEINDALSGLKLHEFVSMAHSNLKVAGAIENLMGKMKKGEKKEEGKGTKREGRREQQRSGGGGGGGGSGGSRRGKDDDLYSDASSSLTPRTDRTNATNATDSRPSTQASDATRETDSRPQTAASSAFEESSFDV